MTLPKKGTRAVVVDDVRYRWHVRKEPTYAQAIATSPMRLAIETEGGGRVLLVDLRVTRPDNWVSPHQTSVTPKLVREMIARALAEGWDPTSAGPPVVLDFPLLRDRA